MKMMTVMIMLIVLIMFISTDDNNDDDVNIHTCIRMIITTTATANNIKTKNGRFVIT